MIHRQITTDYMICILQHKYEYFRSGYTPISSSYLVITDIQYCLSASKDEDLTFSK